MAQTSTSTVACSISAAGGIVVASILAAVVGEETREHPAEQRSQGWAAAGDDGQVDFDAAKGVAERVSRVVALDVELFTQLMDTNDGDDADTKRWRSLDTLNDDGSEGDTYTPPIRKTTIKPTLAAMRILSPRKIQKGIKRTRKSVIIVMMAVTM